MINYYLKYSNDLIALSYSDYYQVKLILYYLFISFTDLLSFDSCTFTGYIKVFQAYKRLYTHLEDFYTDLEVEGSDLDSKSDKDLA